MNILQQKPIMNFEPKIQKIISQLKIFDYPVLIKGSSGLTSQKYFSDYDFYTFINYENETPQQLFTEIETKIKNILKDSNNYFIEFKIQLENGDKIKWESLDDFNFEQFYNVYNDIDFLKFDLITRINFKFFEISYNMFKKKVDTKNRDNIIIKELKDDIKKLTKEGQYYKILKRKFSIYKLEGLTDKLIELTKIFNSDLGEKYQIKSNLEAIKNLLEKTNDDNTIKKIIINLKALGIEPDIKKIDSIINELSNEINNEAKKIKI